jgi:thiamine phosphate synthase YjbQ (UPF0047 family)
MSFAPAEITLALRPHSRVDVIDVTRHVVDRVGEFPGRFRKALYCSHHTTAGYLEQSLCARLNHNRASLRQYVSAFHHLFPEGAGYHHDRLHLRRELSEEQRAVEPLNGDSHLTFIGSGLLSCAAYTNRAHTPVYLIDLDGVNGSQRRVRHTTVIGYNREVVVERTRLTVPVSRHPVDSINIRDPRLGVYQALERKLEEHGITKGRIDLSLAATERQAGLTVNEYETMLMKHDLAEVLRNPLRFVAEKGKHMMDDPRAIPGKTMNYAKYDFVQILNRAMDALGVSNSPIERILDKFLALPAARFLRMKRSVSLLVSNGRTLEPGRIIHGRYQSPILVQWDRTPAQSRELDVTFTRFV